MNFGPQFIFDSYGRYSAFAQPIELQLFYLLLLQRGVYTWERRTCGLSVRHTDEEVEKIIDAVKGSVVALRDNGFEFRAPSGAPDFFAPMAPTQERLFAIFQREHGQDAYHLPLAWRLTGNIDADFAERLEIALGRIILRNEALRTAFVQLEGRLLQKIVAEPRFFLERTGRAENAGLSPEEQLKNFIRPFDLAAAPLLRARLAEQDDGASLFMLDLLHITADGASLGLILNELNSFMQGSLPEDAQPVSFRQAAAAMPAEGREDDLRYWVERLKDLPPLELPYDRPAAAGSPEGEQHWMRIDAELVSRAKAACKTYGITLNMFLNGAYVLLLQALTRGEKFCVAMADGGRRTPQSKSAIGMFVNTVPQLFTVDPKATLRDFFTGIRLSCAESMSRNRAPYGDIVEKLGFSPASTMLSYERADERKPDWPGIAASPLAAHGQGAMYDFAIDIVEMDGVLHCNLAHSAAFSGQSARAFGEVFAQIVRESACRTEILVREIDLLPPRQLEILREEWQSAVRRPDAFKTVLEAVEARCALCPERTALVLEHDGLQESVSYAELREKSDKLARRLLRLGLGPEAVVGILLRRRPGFVIACLAVMKAGAAYLPLDPDFPEERLSFLLEDAEARAVVSAPELMPLLSGYSGPLLDIALPDVPGDADAPVATRSPAEGDLAYILYTSGTTGRPKGVMVEHHSLYNICRFFVRYFEITGADRTTAFAPFIFDASIWELFPMLMQGATVHILHEDLRLNLPQLHDYLRQRKITVSYFLSQVSELIEGERLPDLRLIVCGGDVMHLRRPRGNYRHNNSYGPTEFTVTSHVQDLDGSWPVPLGYPVDNTQSLILDAQGRVMPLGFPGELCLAGSQIARGYLKRPELTAEKFRPNPLAAQAPAGGVDYSRMYATGDLCRRSPEGPYVFMGRMDSQVKIRGHRVETGEVEARLLEHPEVSQAVVRALADEQGHKRLCAYVVPAPGASRKELGAALKSALARSLPPYMAPHYYVFLEASPYRPNGKVDTDALPAPLEQQGGFE
jgi:bacitracin synthase 3